MRLNSEALDEREVSASQDSTESCNGHTELGEASHNPQHLTLQQFVVVEGRLPMRSATTGRTCSACHCGKANNPQQASCGHVCCTPCWMDRFKVSILAIIVV